MATIKGPIKLGKGQPIPQEILSKLRLPFTCKSMTATKGVEILKAQGINIVDKIIQKPKEETTIKPVENPVKPVETIDETPVEIPIEMPTKISTEISTEEVKERKIEESKTVETKPDEKDKKEDYKTKYKKKK
ncbi:MAG: hypothetical protein WC444_05515 [Candidatus Paceibacterota bacterium]